MANKNVARIIIGTPRNRYMLTVPNVDHEAAKKLIADARERAKLENEVLKQEGFSFHDFEMVFEFDNERLEITEYPDYMHQYIKEENYAFDTVTINVHGR